MASSLLRISASRRHVYKAKAKKRVAPRDNFRPPNHRLSFRIMSVFNPAAINVAPIGLRGSSSVVPLATPPPRRSAPHVQLQNVRGHDPSPCSTVADVLSDISYRIPIVTKVDSLVIGVCTVLLGETNMAGPPLPKHDTSRTAVSTTISSTSSSNLPTRVLISTHPQTYTETAPTISGPSSQGSLAPSRTGWGGVSISTPSTSLVSTSTETMNTTINPLSHSSGPGGPSSTSSTSPGPHPLNIWLIVSIVLGAFALLLCIALALFFLLRRRVRRKARRMSVDSSQQRLKRHIYDDDASRRVSSIWTWFGSLPIDPDYQPKRVSRPHSPDSQFSEKHADLEHARRLEACTLGPSPSPPPGETLRHSFGDVSSLSSLHERLPYPIAAASSTQALGASSSSSHLLALAGTDFVMVNPSNCGERIPSVVSRTTASSGDVQSMEAM